MNASKRFPHPGPRMTQPQPHTPPFNFKGPTDTPVGATFKRTKDGFVALAPRNSWLMAIVFGAVSVFIGERIYSESQSPYSSAILNLAGIILLLVSLSLFAFYALGKEGIEISGERLLLKKTIFGLGWSRSMTLKKIMRAQVVKRSGMRGIGYIEVNKVTDQVLELESDTHIKRMGSKLSSEHLYYMRYLIIEAVKAARNTPNP
jgi:hypothetical protein